MDRTVQILCESLKKITAQLKPNVTPLSFLLLIGKSGQGKTELLKQSNLHHYPVDEEISASFFYNQQGIILELGESWLSQGKNLLTATLKQLNRIHSNVKITGIMLCIDSGNLLLVEPLQLINCCKSQALLLKRFSQALGYPVDTALMFSKLDTLAGFCEFFHSEHDHDLSKPLGFSIDCYNQRSKLIEYYKKQFDRMIEVLGQRIINKLHPARSSIKRTLIREFPLQLASLRMPIQALIQQLALPDCEIRAIYFSSARQGGVSIDKLNQKIQHEYALTVQDKFPQSNNFKAYFIEGALQAFQENTRLRKAVVPQKYKLLTALGVTMAGMLLSITVYKHLQTSRLLDEASKELLAYESLSNENGGKTAALYHLSKAENRLALISNSLLTHPMISRLRLQLNSSSKDKLHNSFLPDMINIVEAVIVNPSQTQLARYQALKIYLMLGDPQHYSEKEVLAWFNEHWKNTHPGQLNHQQEFLLLNALKQPIQGLNLNHQLITDARNYLNALPAAYLYYSLAKDKFDKDKISIQIQGFDLAHKEIPVYLSKKGFKKSLASIPAISKQLQQENWILARQDLSDLQAQIEQAYCFDYTNWWQNFIKHSHPQHYQTYEQVRDLAQTLHRTDAISQLTHFIQEQTSPEAAEGSALFNEKIASQFTSLNLLSSSATQELKANIIDLEKFLTTLSLVNDQGKTVFELTRSRFQGESFSDPLSALYNKSRLFPDPIASWTRQVADDIWFIFISESRKYLNKQWQRQVFPVYKKTVAQHYPLDPLQNEEISLVDFDLFFSPQGILNNFSANFLKPFLDTSHPQWKPKELNGYRMPISDELVNELIRSNVIANMFFPDNFSTSKIVFSLQKINLDPVVASLQLTIGTTTLNDSQNSDADISFTWPQAGAKLTLNSIEGNHYNLEETGQWAFFKMLQKVNVLVDGNDSASLQILFEINGNSGRYLLKTQNQINPFSPGILTGFNLSETIA